MCACKGVQGAEGHGALLLQVMLAGGCGLVWEVARAINVARRVGGGRAKMPKNEADVPNTFGF